jgi:hypothetical protein
VGAESVYFPHAIASFKFSKAPDAMAFQAILRKKFLLKVLNTDKIKSNRGEEACFQHMKIWREFEDGRNTISFHGQSRETKNQYEFPLQLIEPRITHPDGTKNSKLVEIRFITPSSKKHERHRSSESTESTFSLRHPSTWSTRSNFSGSKALPAGR